jgi:hypothetical protein
MASRADTSNTLIFGIEKENGGGTMRNIFRGIIVVAVFGIGGLALGYVIFGKIGGEYVDLNVIFSTDKSFLQKAVRSIAGMDAIRSKILWCGAGGALVGFLFELFSGKRG